MRQHRVFFVIVIAAAFCSLQAHQSFKIEAKSERSVLKYALVGQGNPQVIRELFALVRFDLEFSDQIAINRCDESKNIQTVSDQTLQMLCDHDVAGCIVLAVDDDDDDHQRVKVSLYDTFSQEKLLDECVPISSRMASSAHKVSHILLEKIVGQSVALSKIAYCEQPSFGNKVIYISDYACRDPYKVVDSQTINVIPTWHPTKSGLFYSQFTDTNTRLMAYDFKSKQHKVVSSFPGLNMQPSFSPDGKQIVLCLSTKGNSELYLFDEEACREKKTRYYTQLTYNKGNNTSPCLRKNGDIIFCSDFQGGSPQIYYRNSQTQKISRLTQGGYCVGLTYCEKIGTIAFARPVNGIFQLFTLQIDQQGKASSLTQLTHGGGNKRAPTWSPSGKYLAFVYNHSDKNGHSTDQIATLNVASNRLRILTNGPNHKSFPAWC